MPGSIHPANAANRAANEVGPSTSIHAYDRTTMLVQSGTAIIASRVPRHRAGRDAIHNAVGNASEIATKLVTAEASSVRPRILRLSQANPVSVTPIARHRCSVVNVTSTCPCGLRVRRHNTASASPGSTTSTSSQIKAGAHNTAAPARSLARVVIRPCQTTGSLHAHSDSVGEP